MSASLEIRVKRLESAVATIVKQLALELEIRDELGVDPFDYARDDVDKKIITELLLRKVATATELHKKLKLRSPTRQAVGKRLQRMMKESDALGVQWLEYNPKRLQNHFRAWWIIPEAIKTEILTQYEKE